MRIFIFIDGIESGPFTREEIFRKLRDGEISPTDAARCEEDSGWSSIDDILKQRAKFFTLDQIQQSPPPPPPPPPIILPDFTPTLSAPVEEEKVSKSRFYLIAILLLVGVLFAGVHIASNRPDAQASAESTHEDIERFEATTKVASSSQPPEDAAKAIGAASTASENPKPLQVSKALKENEATESSDPDGIPPPADSPSVATAAEVPPDLAPPQLEESNVAAQEMPSESIVSEENAKVADETNEIPMPSATSSQVKQKKVETFFKLESVKLLKKAPRDKVGVWADKFQQCLEVRVSVEQNISSSKTLSKIYFFDDNNSLITKQDKPTPSGRPGHWMLDMPGVFKGDAISRFFFQVPPELLEKRWKAVIVFGDEFEAHSICFPTTEKDFLLEYPEKALVYDRNRKAVERKPAMDALSEYVSKTNDPANPKITMLLRPPAGVSDPEEIKGVLALCVFAESVEWIKNELTKDETSGDFGELFKFANANKLAILAWGAQGRFWNPFLNYDDLPPQEAQNFDRIFDNFSNAWERGAKILTARFGLPQKDFLLWGLSRSAQWAHRLCLRKPQYFLAIHVHVSSSYDRPRPEASKVLWCVTTGELDGGYQRSQRFYSECKKMGYPFLFKAAPGLGHSQSQGISKLGIAFFDYALSMKRIRDQKAATANKNSDSAPALPWSEEFKNPPFYGDLLNQELFSADQVQMIPKTLRVSLPTEKLAERWLDSQ